MALREFIDQAFQHTSERQLDIVKSYQDIVEKSSDKMESLSNVQSVFNSLYDYEGKSMKGLNTVEVKDLLKKVNGLLKNIDTGLSAKEEKTADVIKDAEVVNLLRNVRDMLQNWQKADQATPFALKSTTLVDQIADIMETRRQSINDIQQLVTSILTKTTHGGYWGERNAGRLKSEMTALFVEKLGTLNVELGPEATLSDIVDKYGFSNNAKDYKNKDGDSRHIDSFIKEANVKLMSFGKLMSPEQYVRLREEYAKNREIFSADFEQSPKETFQTLGDKYGKFNDALAGDSMTTIREKIQTEFDRHENLRKEIERGLDEFEGITEQSKKALLKPRKEKYLNEIESFVREIYKAISNKNDGIESKAKNEILEFNKRLPGVLSRLYGTKEMPVLSLGEDGRLKMRNGNQVRLDIEMKREADGGDSQFFEEFANDGSELYKVGRSVVFGNKHYNDLMDLHGTKVGKDIINVYDLFEKPSVVIKDNAEYDPRFTGVLISVGKTDQLFFRTDKMYIEEGEPLRTKDYVTTSGNRFMERFKKF
jgi:hypothetical protein